MDRRSFVALAGSIGHIPATGCIGSGGPTRLSNKKEKDGKSGTQLHFTENGESLITLTVRTGRRRTGPGGGQMPLDISVWHRQGTKIRSLSLRLGAVSGEDTRVRFALKTPLWKPHPSIELYPEGDKTVFEIDKAGYQGGGTMHFEFIAASLVGSVSELEVGTTIEVAEQRAFGNRYKAEGVTKVGVPGGGDSG